MPELQPTILLVEDNEEDVFLLRRALRKAAVSCSLQVATDGEEAIDYLAGKGTFTDRSRHPAPSLVLLDLKLPYVNGFEVLAWIATQRACKDLRVIILTSSGEEPDRAKAEQFGIQEYFLKPPSPELITRVAQAMQAINSAAAK
jgi:CheY-like chemotaxis protein